MSPKPLDAYHGNAIIEFEVSLRAKESEDRRWRRLLS